MTRLAGLPCAALCGGVAAAGLAVCAACAERHVCLVCERCGAAPARCACPCTCHVTGTPYREDGSLNRCYFHASHGRGAPARIVVLPGGRAASSDDVIVRRIAGALADECVLVPRHQVEELVAGVLRAASRVGFTLVRRAS